MKLKQHIPNAITSLNLFFGTVGIYLAIAGRPDLTAWCILAAALLDFMDGFAARMLNAYSDIGKDLDSLADLISFGVAPAAVFSSLIHFHYTGTWGGAFLSLPFLQMLMVLTPFVLAVFAALRLAKFNNDDRQSDTFLGLTTTATGMFAVSLAYLIVVREGAWLQLTNPLVVIFIVLVFSALLVSEMPMFSLKFSHFKWKGNKPRFLLMALSLLAIIFTGVGAFAFIIPLYIVLSLFLTMNKSS
ncbi:CDP-alcohol phosphatidyltransferase family protein [Natronoflexus pectinivorans]|uniref:CDP-diacylglycerol--serine O-phosphatidyltransferase n=1 Tax=Natronoflexus pectinivorans TaxID=682526 RepID=A0A4R2GMS6_9BACT|nr:CDP-alcohol phosphatidyltransferase family protein [Natronoflexus pectinivorans]TCO10533.1 CDP-diacylglycerol--serine O-phosphatidyltransferase [Natronoflexus pectinivorans]